MNAPVSSRLYNFVQQLSLGWWPFVAAVAVCLLLLPIATAFLDGQLANLWVGGLWRVVFLPSAIIVYILAIIEPLDQVERRTINGFRALAQLDETSYSRAIAEASAATLGGELLAFAAGVLGGLFLSIFLSDSDGSRWLIGYMHMANALMYGMLGWSIYSALMGTRLMEALHQLPLEIDLFNLDPFDHVGRQSLYAALAFVGGATIALLFSLRLTPRLTPTEIVIYGTLALVTVLVFFLNMRPCHRLLAEVKQRELIAVERAIADCYRTLRERKDAGLEVEPVAVELATWIACEQRLEAVRTWPYDVGMLQALLVTVLFPIAIELASVIVGGLFP